MNSMSRILSVILYFTVKEVLYSKKKCKLQLLEESLMCNIYESMPHTTNK